MPSLKAKIHRGIQAFLLEDDAATAIEYGLITAAMCIVVAASMSPIAKSGLWEVFKVINDRLVAFTTQ